MTTARELIYAGYRHPAEIISYGVWLYLRFPLSLRIMEEMLAARGISVTHETIGKGALKTGSDSGEQSGGLLALDAALTQADMTHEGHIYKGVNHGFHNDATPQYDEAAAKEAWQRMEQAATSGGQGRVAPWRALSAHRLHRHQPGAAG